MNSNIIVKPSGKLIWNGKEYKCAIGKGGVTKDKKEGDGKTPVGCFPIRKIFYRADRILKPQSVFKTFEITPADGWCDDPKDLNYNRQIKLPYGASYENLWRNDNLYDVIVVLGYNDNPPVAGKGSAIFMHLARPDYAPTLGCIALSLEDLLKILREINVNTRICVEEENN